MSRVFDKGKKGLKDKSKRRFLQAVAAGVPALPLLNQPPGGEGKETGLAADKSSAVESTHGISLLDTIAHDKQNVVLPILECQLEGFGQDGFSYRVPTVRRIAKQGRILAKSPVAGSFYPGFFFYDTAGNERISISINGAERGVAIADADNNRDCLFFLTEPYIFHKGETVELRNLNTDGIYRTEDLILLKEKPAARAFSYTVSELFAQPKVEGDQATAELTWITSWPVACKVEWGMTGKSVVTATEEIAFNNHRQGLNSLQQGQTYRYRITAKAPDGALVASEWKAFTVRPPAKVAGKVKKEQVPLAIRNPQDTGLTGPFPVTSGVPFPRGALGSDLHLRLLDPQGQEIPVQTKVLGQWDDGSLKWVLLDFQAPASTAYTLEYGTEVRRRNFPTSLRVRQTEGEVKVATGPLRFTVIKRRFGLLESLSLGSDQVISPAHPGVVELTAIDQTLYTSLGPPDEVVVEDAGPLRATVRAGGSYRAADGRKLFAYTVRIHAYADQPFVRVQHTLGNDCGEGKLTSIRSLTIRLPFVTKGAAAERRWVLGGSPDQEGRFHTSERVSLRQHTDNHYAIRFGDGESISQGERAAGWAEWRDGTHRVTLAVRDFWQTYPNDLSVSADGLELGMCPLLRKDEYSSAKGTVDECRLYYYLQDGAYKLRQGMTATQDIWLEFGSASAQQPARIRSDRSPLLAVAPPRWHARSGAFGELSVGQEELLVCYDAAYARAFKFYLEDREYQRSYGMLNFGDWWGERYLDWGNSEYDTQNALFLQYVRTGDVRYFLAGEQMEWHNRDVDTIHYDADKSRIGGVYHHSVGHTGGYFPKGALLGAPIVVGILTVDHVWTRGHLAYYFLTGDRRSLETAGLIGRRYDSYATVNFDFDNCRVAGWHLIMTMSLYQATGDRYYLNAARIIVDRVVERQTPDGGWDFWGICLGTYGNFGFTMGIMLSGLRMYFESTGDERAAEEIVRGARFFAKTLWVDSAQLFKYANCADWYARSPSITFLLLDGMCFAHQRTHDPELRHVLLAATSRALEGLEAFDPAVARANASGVGKEFGMYVCSTPYFIGYIAGLQE